MSHGVHEAQHQADHIREHEEHGHGGGAKPLAENFNKKVALLISVIALFLAISETMGKSAQTSALNHQIEASNLWNFFQAKTIRRTLVETIAQEMEAHAIGASNETAKAKMTEKVAFWQAEAKRYRSEPEAGGGKGEGSTELARRAKGEEKIRDDYLAKYHHYEVASAAFQIGIVLASAAVITGMVALVYGSIGLGVIGLIFVGIGLFAPHAVHLL